MQIDNKYISVQALRGLAALSVMFFHFRHLLNEQFPGRGDALFGWGAVGVDLFFIISGFVITLSAKKLGTGRMAARQFIKNRLLRIMPTYFFLLIITFLLSGGMSTFHYQDKINNLISALTFSPIFENHAPYYIDDSAMYSIRWTLNYEFYFYIAACFCLLFKRSFVILLAFFSSMLVLFPAIYTHEIIFSAEGYQLNNPYLNLITNPISWMFISGVLIALTVPLHFKINTKISKIYLLFVTAIMIYNLFIVNNLGHGLTTSGWSLVLFFSGIVINDHWLKKLTPKGLVFLGNISFSLYLIHSLMNTGIGRRLTWTGWCNGINGFVFYTIFSLFLATLSYNYIEQFSKKLSFRKYKQSLKQFEEI